MRANGKRCHTFIISFSVTIIERPRNFYKYPYVAGQRIGEQGKLRSRTDIYKEARVDEHSSRFTQWVDNVRPPLGYIDSGESVLHARPSMAASSRSELEIPRSC